MERKECLGSIEEITGRDGLTTIKTRPECRDCGDFRDCLHQSKQRVEENREKDELRKQNLIVQIIDISHMISNELGSCLLDFLNRIYDSPLGTVLFKNLMLFCEMPKEVPSHSFSIPISPSTLELLRGERTEDPFASDPSAKRKEGSFIRVVIIQRHFLNKRKANMGLIAYEVTRLISSDQNGILQIIKALSHSEISRLKKMDADQRISWLMNKWGFQEELEALKKEMNSTQ
jgi:hypothetical protein